MSEDSEIEEEQHFFVEPYLFEDAELRLLDEAATAAHEPNPQPAAEYRSRALETWWCSCFKCKAMTTDEESLCCSDWELAMPAPQNLDTSMDETAALQRPCITDHPERAHVNTEHREAVRATGHSEAENRAHTMFLQTTFYVGASGPSGSLRMSMPETPCGFNPVFLAPSATRCASRSPCRPPQGTRGLQNLT